MKNTTKRAYVLIAVLAAFFVGFAILIYTFVMNGSDWATNKANRHLYSDGSISAAGAIYDCDGDVLAKTVDGARKYNESSTVRKATLHTIGDLNGFIATGVQYTYRHTLTGYDFVNGLSSIVQYGKGNDIHLTIDSDACEVAYKALNGRKGAVGVYNYKTGEIICMVSAPTYDPKSKPSDIDTNKKYEGVYLNRVLSGLYTPGSTFKVITAASAIENIPDIYERKFKCTGKYDTGDGTVICNSTHGTVNFEQALNRSCNSAFAQIAIELGAEKLTVTARELGFNAELNVDGIASPENSLFDVSKTNKVDLGWAGIGQYTTLANPYQMMTAMGCIANSGVAVEPYVVDYVQSPKLLRDVTQSQTSEEISLPADVANKLKAMLRSNVKNYYGDSKFPGLEMCGKTGTAQIDDGEPHSWFVGFSQRSDTPYAIVVVVENGGTGLKAAGTVANKVMQEICS
ncbi:MAG: penicillin-binding protein 2 [Clostridia bacterium]|nr:penicillin-binding protein 2 [Clostridia bacterium]